MVSSDRRDFLKWMALTGLMASGCQSQGLRSKLSPQADKVLWYWNPDSLKHTRNGQAENALRGEAVLKALKSKNLQNEVVAKVARQASEEELQSFHQRSYIEEIKNWPGTEIFYRSDRWAPYSSPGAYGAAASAAGAAIDLVHDVYTGKQTSGFATIRPPGHHAVSNQPMGYCIFNNVAVAVRQLQRKFPQAKVAILDLDAHHGNGIQEAFYSDPRVLYISLHQNEWPNTGNMEQKGEGPGIGSTVNIPLPALTGDRGYAEVFESLVEPILDRFAPEILIVPMGFDTHWKDPQSFLEMSSSGQAQILLQLKNWAQQSCQGKLALVLEGGYQMEVLQDGVYNAFQVLLGKPATADSFGVRPGYQEPPIGDLIKKVAKIHGL